MKLYVTKYALTTGVELVEFKDMGPAYIMNHATDGRRFFANDCFETEVEALDEVKRQARAKLTSLRKAIQKIESILASAEKGILPMRPE